jgi:peptide/nickel transport system substrate-binding protein
VRRAAVKSAGAILATGVVLAGCGSGTKGTSGGGTGGSGSGAIMRYAVPGTPTSFDPRKSGPLDPIFLDLVYESLVKRTMAGQLTPGLATEWHFADGNRTLTFKLRQGVTFQNGEKLDGAAVKTVLDAYRKTGVLVGSLSSLKKVDAVGPSEVRLTFAEPAGYMLNVLAGEAGMMVAPKALGDPGLGTKPVGTGPFKLSALQQGKVSFRKFDGYWNAASVGIGGIDMPVFSDESTRLRALKSGQADGTTIDMSQIKEAEKSGLTVVKGPNTTFRGLLLNTGQSKLADPNVRRALLYAIDREAINKSLYAGGCTPSVQPFQQGFWAHAPALENTAPYHDVNKAKQYLAQAGYPNGLSMTLEVGPNTSYQVLAQALQAQLKQAGINVSIKVLQFQQMIESRRTGKFTATVAVLQAGRPDASQFAADYFTKGGLYNPGGFTLPGIDKLLAQARASENDAERAPAMQSIFTQVLQAGSPVVPVCDVTYVAAFRKGVTGGAVSTVGDYDFTRFKIQ